jgi:putative aldouronate transport system permease protein
VAYWNDWSTGTFYVENQKMWTLQTFLQLSVLKGRGGTSLFDRSMIDRFMSPQEVDEYTKLNSISLETAYIMVSTVPILILYPFLQKYFVKGVMIGSIKE